MNTIEIRPYFRESAQARNTFNVIDGKRVGTTKAPGGKFNFFIGDSAKNKRLAIDLGYLVPNPWHQDKAGLPASWKQSGIDEQEQITKQQELEIKYDKPAGFLTTESFDAFDVDAITLKRKKRTYLQSIMHMFEDQKNTLVLNNLHDEVIYEAIKSSKFFAMSYEEANAKPMSVRFYVSHLEQEAEEKANRNKIRMRTIGNLRDLIEKYPGQTAKVAKVLKLIKGKVADEIVENTLYDYIESTENKNYSGENNFQRGTKFNNMFKLATSKKAEDKKRFSAMILAQDLLDKRVLTENMGVFTWHSKRGTSLEKPARSYEALLSFLQDPQSHELVEEMKEEMKAVI